MHCHPIFLYLRKREILVRWWSLFSCYIYRLAPIAIAKCCYQYRHNIAKRIFRYGIHQIIFSQSIANLFWVMHTFIHRTNAPVGKCSLQVHYTSLGRVCPFLSTFLPCSFIIISLSLSSQLLLYYLIFRIGIHCRNRSRGTRNRNHTGQCHCRSCAWLRCSW